MRRAPALALALVLAAGEAPARAAAPVDVANGPQVPQDPVSAATTPPELALPPIPAALHAQRLEEGGKLLQAAVLFEQLATDGDLRYLFHAARVRAALGHHGHARLHLSRWLARAAGLGEPARQVVAQALAVENAATDPLLLQLVDAGVALPLAGAQLHLEALTGAAAGDRLDLTGDEAPELRVDAGAWQVRLDAPGRGGISVRCEVSRGNTNTCVAYPPPRPVVVSFRFTPERALRHAHLRLTPLDRAGEPIQRPLSAPDLTFGLPSGRWQLDVEARRYEAHQGLVVTPETRDVAVQLVRRTGPAGPTIERDRKLFAGLMATFGVSYFTGVGLILAGVNIEQRAEDRNQELLTAAGWDPKADLPPTLAAEEAADADYPTAEYHADLARGVNLNYAGALVAMSSLGAPLALMPVLIKKSRRALYIEMGVGAAFIAGAAPWSAWMFRQQAAVLGGATPESRVLHDHDHLTGHRLGASMILGLGAGLVLYPAITLAVDAVRRRRGRPARAHLLPEFTPASAGLGVSGRF